jgi:anthranilate phosphoribosyltransferase
MDENLEKLHKIDAILAKLVDGNDLTAEEAEELIYHIFVYDTEGMHFATFVGAIHAKGETADELLGFLNATKRLAVKFDLGIDVNKTTDLSGTGGGKFKTINVSTAASFAVAAAGYTVAKEAYYAVTSPTGSADMFTVFGVDFLKLTKEQVEEALQEIGICPIIAPFISPKLENRSRLSRKFFVERQVRVRSPFHLASNIYSPLPMNHRVYGCYSERYLEVLATLFNKLGFKRSLTFYGEIGLPEISNVGKTMIVEQNGEDIKRYVVQPSDLGVDEATEEEIKTGGKEQNIVDFVEILKGKKKEAKSDLVAVNAGAALYALEDVKTISDGSKKAQEILSAGEGYGKFEQLINKIGSPELLKRYN